MSSLQAHQAQHGTRKKKDLSLLTKTVMCKFFAANKCRKGIRCPFAHEASELVVPPNLYRTQLCATFRKTGTCAAGDSCDHAHFRSELRSLPEAIHIPDASTDSESCASIEVSRSVRLSLTRPQGLEQDFECRSDSTAATSNGLTSDYSQSSTPRQSAATSPACATSEPRRGSLCDIYLPPTSQLNIQCRAAALPYPLLGFTPPPGLSLPEAPSPPLALSLPDDPWKAPAMDTDTETGLFPETDVATTQHESELRTSSDYISIGSSLHLSGGCKPCAFFHKPGGCHNGEKCTHCHLCPAGEIASRRSRARATRQSANKQVKVTLESRSQRGDVLIAENSDHQAGLPMKVAAITCGTTCTPQSAAIDGPPGLFLPPLPKLEPVNPTLNRPFLNLDVALCI
jgi:hypothetical protein